MEFSNAEALEAEHRLVAVCAEYPAKIDLVDAREEDFFDLRWRMCMAALRELHDSGDGIDPLVLLDRVVDQIQAKGAKLSHSDLVNLDASPVLVGEYSRIVTEEAAKRRLVLGLSQVIEQEKQGATAEEMLTAASQAVSAATIGQADQARTISDIVQARYLELGEIADKLAKGDYSATGIPTGIENLDKHLGGLQRGIVTLIAARPAMGKSAVALNFCEAASANGTGVHIFSMEETADAYADRVISYHSGVSTKTIRSCTFNRGDMQRIGMAGTRMATRKHWMVDDRSGISAEEIVRCVRRNRAANETELVIVDYIGLLRQERGENRVAMLTAAINTFGDAAKQDNQAYVVLSQLNRGLESRDDKRPQLSDLKDCGALEERAKAVVMVYRDSVYNEHADESKMELLIRKNSNGLTGCVSVKWEPERMRVS